MAETTADLQLSARLFTNCILASDVIGGSQSWLQSELKRSWENSQVFTPLSRFSAYCTACYWFFDWIQASKHRMWCKTNLVLTSDSAYKELPSGAQGGLTSIKRILTHHSSNISCKISSSHQSRAELVQNPTIVALKRYLIIPKVLSLVNNQNNINKRLGGIAQSFQPSTLSPVLLRLNHGRSSKDTCTSTPTSLPTSLHDRWTKSRWTKSEASTWFRITTTAN